MDVKNRIFFFTVAAFLSVLSSSCQFNFDPSGDQKRNIDDGDSLPADPEHSNIFGEGGTSSTPAKITVLLKSKNAHPIKGIVPSFRVTPTSPHDSHFNCTATNIDGEANCSFRTLDVETRKNLHITYPVSKAGESVTFKRSPTMLEEERAPSEAGTKSMESFEIQPKIILKDPLGIIVDKDNSTTIKARLKTISSDTLGSALLFKNGELCLTSGCAFKPVDGVVDFSIPENTLSADHSGTFSIIYSAEHAEELESSPFKIRNGTAERIEFLQQPSKKVSTIETFPQQPIIAIRDAQGNLITTEPGDGSFSALVTMELLEPNNPPASTLVGSIQQHVSKGIANFTGNGLKVELSESATEGPGYVLKAIAKFSRSGSSTEKTALSRPFIVTRVGESRSLFFSTQPSNAVTTGVILPQQPILHLLDINGNLATSDNTTEVELTIEGKQTNDDGTESDGILEGTTTRRARDGIIFFNDIKIENPFDSTITSNPGDYTLIASVTNPSSTTIDNASSIRIRVEQPGKIPTALNWINKPGVTGRNQVIYSTTGDKKPLRVAIMDGAGNIVKADNRSIVNVVVEFGEGELSGTTTKTVKNGIATFGNLSLDTIGSHTLKATAQGLRSVISGSFYVNTNGTPSKLKFITRNDADKEIGPPRIGETNRGMAGKAFPRKTIVEVQDESGNHIVSESGTRVTLSCSEPENCILKGTTEAVVIEGRAIFPKRSLFIENSIGNSIQITATSSVNYQEDTLFGIAIDAGAIDNYRSSIAATPPSAPGVNDGIVAVVVKDQFGNSHIGKAVTLNLNPTTGACTSRCSNTDREGTSICSFSCNQEAIVTISVESPKEITQTAVLPIPPPEE